MMIQIVVALMDIIKMTKNNAWFVILNVKNALIPPQTVQNVQTLKTEKILLVANVLKVHISIQKITPVNLVFTLV